MTDVGRRPSANDLIGFHGHSAENENVGKSRRSNGTAASCGCARHRQFLGIGQKPVAIAFEVSACVVSKRRAVRYTAFTRSARTARTLPDRTAERDTMRLTTG